MNTKTWGVAALVCLTMSVQSCSDDTPAYKNPNNPVEVRVADLLKVTGYVRGGCSPLGMKKPFVTVLDESCLSQPTIAVSAGHIGFQVELAPRDLMNLAKATAADLTQGDLT